MLLVKLISVFLHRKNTGVDMDTYVINDRQIRSEKLVSYFGCSFFSHPSGH